MKLRAQRASRAALTLLELVVVVGIVALFAGLVSFRLSPDQLTFAGAGGGKTAARIATEASMGRIRAAMFGSADSPGYWADMNKDIWFWPRYLDWLSTTPSDVVPDVGDLAPEEFVYYDALLSGYNAERKIGWRGPYVQFEGIPVPLDSARGFTARLGGGSGHRAPSDAWGNPIVMQWPSNTPYTGMTVIESGESVRGNLDATRYVMQNSRLVSAGPDGILQTEINLTSLQAYEHFLLNPSLAGDDVVVWLQR